MGGLLTLEDITNTKAFGRQLYAEANYGNEANYGTYQSQDPFAVAVIKDGRVVRHVPSRVSRTVSFFLGKDGSVAFCEVTGAMVNRAAGFGLEILCVYLFHGRQAYIERLKNLLL